MIKTKLLLAMIALLGITLQSRAQEATLPKCTKVLKVLNRGVNVREQPSTTSAKIGSNPEFLLVIDEDAEWYHAYVLTNGESEGEFLPKPGYISKKVCKTREPKALTPTYAHNAMDEANMSLCIRETGRYKGYCTISYNEYYAASNVICLFVGKLFGNYAMGVQYWLEWDYDRVRSFGDDGELLNIPETRVWDTNTATLDWSGLTDAEIDKLFGSLNNGEIHILLPGKVRYTYRDGDGATGEGVACYKYYANGKPNYDDDVDLEEEEEAAPLYPTFQHEKFALKPLNYNKFVEVIKDGVNIRKQPNTQSPRLMTIWDPDAECMDCPAERKWTTKQLKPSQGESAAHNGLVMPLIGESGDWYQVFIGEIGGWPILEPGYISKQFCTVHSKKPLQLPIDYTTEYGGCFRIAIVESGKYKGLCTVVDIDESGYTDPVIMLGVYANGMCICPYAINFYNYEESNSTYIKGGNLYVKKSDLSKASLSTSSALHELLMKNLHLMSSETTTIYYDYTGSDSPEYGNYFSLPTSMVLQK